MQYRVTFTVVALSAFAAACADSAPPTALRAMRAPALAQGVSNDMQTKFLVPVSGFDLGGDNVGAFAEGSASRYKNAECGVHSVIFIDNGGGDAVMEPSNPKFANRKCASYPRKLWVGGATNAFVVASLYVPRVNRPGAEIPVGNTEDRALSINPASGLCGRYSFDGVGGADFASVTRTSATTWQVASKSGGLNHARCVSGTVAGVVYTLNVSFTIQGL